MKNYEEMTEKELLIELLKAQEKNGFHNRVNAVANVLVCTVLICGTLVFGPKALSALNRVNTTTQEVETLVIQAQNSLVEIDDMVQGVDDLVDQNTEALTETINDAQTAVDRINEIDIDSLNNSIETLNKVLEPLSKFFKVF